MMVFVFASKLNFACISHISIIPNVKLEIALLQQNDTYISREDHFIGPQNRKFQKLFFHMQLPNKGRTFTPFALSLTISWVTAILHFQGHGTLRVM